MTPDEACAFGTPASGPRPHAASATKGPLGGAVGCVCTPGGSRVGTGVFGGDLAKIIKLELRCRDPRSGLGNNGLALSAFLSQSRY